MNDLDFATIDERLKALARHGATSADLAPPAELRQVASGRGPRRPVLIAGLVGLTAAAVTAMVLILPGHDDHGTVVPSGPPSSTIEPTPGPGNDLPTTPLGTDLRVGANLTVTVPAGWDVREDGDAYRPSVCLTPPGNPRGLRDPSEYCGLEIYTGAGVEHYFSPIVRPNTAYEPGAGWQDQTDVSYCPAGDEKAGADAFNALVPMPSSESGLRPFGDKQASYDLYPNRCDDGYTFNVQAWLLPTSKILVLEYGDLDDATAQVLASARFS